MVVGADGGVVMHLVCGWPIYIGIGAGACAGDVVTIIKLYRQKPQGTRSQWRRY